MKISFSVDHDLADAIRETEALRVRLDRAIPEATQDSVALFGRAVISQILERTTMGPGIAEAITKSEAVESPEGARGLIKFTEPKPYKIEPKPGRIGDFLERSLRTIRPEFSKPRHPTLRFVIGGRTVFARSVQHPGARPWKLLPEGAKAAWPGAQKLYEDRIDDAMEGS